MSFVPPDPNVSYPIPPGQLPPGFVPPPPGTAVRGIPIVVPIGLEMLISPEGFPVFVPERSTAPPPYAASPPSASNSSPALSQQHQQQHQTPTLPSRHSTISLHHSSSNSYTGPPPPVPTVPTSHTSPPNLPYQMPVHSAPPGHHAPLTHATSSQAVPPVAGVASPPAALTFASIVTSFRTSSESGSAWTFYSLGLTQNPGQKEIVITLRQRPGSYSLDTIQPIMYNLYQQMNAHIQSSGGKPLGAGDVFPCRLNTPDLGPLDLAILLVHAPPECKGSLENKDVLYGLIATLDEMAVFSKYGAARTLTNMGNDLETWPIPLWSDWSRPSLLALHDFRGSLTEMVSVLPTKNIVATLDTISHRLTLVVSNSALELIQADLRKFPPAQPGVISDLARITFLLDLDAGAQAYLTWRSGQDGPAIFNARPNPTSFHGCWMSFSGINPHEEATVKEYIAPREDGIEVKMKGSTWERLYQAMISRTPAIVPVGSETLQLSYA
ncbi:hypothetical protein BX616_000126 [Lobosporangium transversale]|uniref:Uncharacterized protein n=1 Tax=Lobosporangium transversale TaxID=64571 RepID=A0A1Y2GE27_9FUNG|nr:hypothetical protein BCR41DRAFT_189517 [Lobosporangium transversale]KAF9908483.1 hypothetical protein BX616_000126 [Lobosporangium transversale]ORZ05166.1 hypothetical protein BCR41DRAFT_189517 [Lobosporangium transversale]|eukprot:XP_021876941.1 hypothetical protein BCR41DRAFT_189517 [Lobosporangium transversale]